MLSIYKLFFAGANGSGEKDRGIDETTRRGNGKTGGGRRIFR